MQVGLNSEGLVDKSLPLDSEKTCFLKLGPLNNVGIVKTVGLLRDTQNAVCIVR